MYSLRADFFTKHRLCYVFLISSQSHLIIAINLQVNDLYGPKVPAETSDGKHVRTKSKWHFYGNSEFAKENIVDKATCPGRVALRVCEFISFHVGMFRNINVVTLRRTIPAMGGFVGT